MKIKEVCEKTGLTERAIRLYLEKGLLNPPNEWRRGRTYYEYGEAEIARLKEISAFRSVGFSLENIREMIEHPENLPNILKVRCQEIREETVSAEENAKILEPLTQMQWINCSYLAKAIRQKNPQTILNADIKPDFGRADELTQEERTLLSQRAERNLVRMNHRKRLRIGLLAILCGLLILAAGIFGYWFRYERQILSMTTFTSSVRLSEPFYWQDSEGTMHPAAYVTLLETGDDFPVFFREAEGSPPFFGYFPDTEYAAIRFDVDIPRRDARKLQLLDGDLLNIQRVEEKIFSDDVFCLKYLTITDYQVPGVPPEIRMMPDSKS
ncbi:MAG: MerR family transcriptional regulator [Candidatus Merdivicinus sp.]|jgi:DNA-binding transcriptional MerR regulator